MNRDAAQRGAEFFDRRVSFNRKGAKGRKGFLTAEGAEGDMGLLSCLEVGFGEGGEFAVAAGVF